jgi:hypothetical protein
MKIVVSILCRGCFALSLLLLSTLAASSQDISEEFCKQIKDSVVGKLNPTNIRNADTYDNKCMFDFTVAGDVDVSLDLEKLNTEQASHESIDRFLYGLAVHEGFESQEQLPLAKFDAGETWNEVHFVRGTTTNSAILLLRKGGVRITVLSHREEVLTQIEQLLRDNSNVKSQ